MKRLMVVWKYRFDIGWQFMTLVNLSLLVISSSGTLRRWLHIDQTWILILVMVIFSFGGVLCFGYFLDRFVRFMEAYSDEGNKRNPYLVKLTDQLDRIEKKLNEN